MKLTGAQISAEMSGAGRESSTSSVTPAGVVLDIYDELARTPQISISWCATNRPRSMPRTAMPGPLPQSGGGPGDLRTRRHQHGDRHRLGLPGLHPHRGVHRPGAHRPHRQRRLSGSGHRRHHPALHQAQLPGQGRQRSGPDDPRGLPYRPVRAAGSGAGGPAQGRESRPVRCPSFPRPSRSRATTPPTTPIPGR